jgi:hypothetical protein
MTTFDTRLTSIINPSIAIKAFGGKQIKAKRIWIRFYSYVNFSLDLLSVDANFRELIFSKGRLIMLSWDKFYHPYVNRDPKSIPLGNVIRPDYFAFSCWLPAYIL